jgi:hypothetical protein
MVRLRSLLVALATAFAGGCFFVIDGLDDGERGGALECRSPDDCVGAALPCSTLDPAACGCGTFKRCESGRCSWVSVDCISRPDAGNKGSGECLVSADCPSDAPICEAPNPAACAYGKCKSCQYGRCVGVSVDCIPGGAGSGGRVKCLKSADCPGAEPLCDAFDPAACGCGAFRRCESGLCTTAKVACPPVCKFGYDQTCNDDPEVSSLEGVCLASGTCSCRTGTKVNPATGRCRLDPQKPDAGSGGRVKCLKSADCPGAEPLCDALDPAACGCGAFRRCESGFCTTAKVACPPVCKFGYDQTCNDDLEISSLEGVCLANGTCSCRPGTELNPATGRCRLE